MLHMLEHLGKFSEWNFGIHEIARANFATGHTLQSLPDESRRVMESGLDGDLRIMERIRIHGYLRASRAAAEQVDGAATANHLQRPFPRLRRANGFDHGIGAAAA